MFQITILPLGQSGFPYLRESGAAYVDKTEHIHELAEHPARILLTRPRRFGKSLLVSALESLFRHGLRDFHGLKIEDLWRDKTYDVVRLDFSALKFFSDERTFTDRFSQLLLAAFEKVGFPAKREEDLFPRLDAWLRNRPARSLVVLVDEYDAPLTANLDHPALFEAVRSVLRRFFSVLDRNAEKLRFLFVTSIAKFGDTEGPALFGNLDDLSLDSRFGSLFGFTADEIRTTFAEPLLHAAQVLHLGTEELLLELEKRYGGFCFDESARTRVLSPWSVLKFLGKPGLGFKPYWCASGGNESVLKKRLAHSDLADPRRFNALHALPLSALRKGYSPQGSDVRPLLAQAGYLTIRSVAGETATFGYPNWEVTAVMAALYAGDLLRGDRPRIPGGPTLFETLAEGSVEDVVTCLNHLFEKVDRKKLSVADEAELCALLQAVLLYGGVEAERERDAARDRCVLVVEADSRRWLFSLRLASGETDADDLLHKAVKGLQKRPPDKSTYGRKTHCVVLVFDAETSAFVQWATV